MPAKKIKLQRPRNEEERKKVDEAMYKKYRSAYTTPEELEARTKERLSRVYSGNREAEVKAIKRAAESTAKPKEKIKLKKPITTTRTKAIEMAAMQSGLSPDEIAKLRGKRKGK